jgi:hypothetical protein
MKSILIILLLIINTCLYAQELTRFTLLINEERIDAPVSVALDGINYNTDKGNLILYEISGKNETMVPSQIEPGHSATLWFILKGVTAKNSKRSFVLKQEAGAGQAATEVRLKKLPMDLSITSGDKPVLSYRYEMTFPPEGVNPLYKRSGFIHPLVSPGGEVLSRIQAPDHYHHYGIWGPWTLTHIDDREVDFWNLAKGEGTVRFAAFLSETEGPIFSGFKACSSTSILVPVVKTRWQ